MSFGTRKCNKSSSHCNYSRQMPNFKSPFSVFSRNKKHEDSWGPSPVSKFWDLGQNNKKRSGKPDCADNLSPSTRNSARGTRVGVPPTQHDANYRRARSYKPRVESVPSQSQGIPQSSPTQADAQIFSETYVLLENGYRPLRKLGSGRYCKVLLAEDARLGLVAGANVAIKVIDERRVRDEFVNKFLPRETNIWPALSHPHLVKMKDCFKFDRKTYLVLELIDGGDLLEYIKSNGAVCEQQLYYWMKQLTAAVSYLHDTANVAHRDLKLENILIANNGDLKITDFGFCRMIDETSMSTTYCGSKAYSAPELLQGLAYDARKSDVWSLGVIAFILATAYMPFNEHVNNNQLLKMQKERQYDYPSALGLSKECMEFIDLLMTFDWHARPKINQLTSTSLWFDHGPNLCNPTQYSIQ